MVHNARQQCARNHAKEGSARRQAAAARRPATPYSTGAASTLRAKIRRTGAVRQKASGTRRSTKCEPTRVVKVSARALQCCVVVRQRNGKMLYEGAYGMAVRQVRACAANRSGTRAGSAAAGGGRRVQRVQQAAQRRGARASGACGVRAAVSGEPNSVAYARQAANQA